MSPHAIKKRKLEHSARPTIDRPRKSAGLDYKSSKDGVDLDTKKGINMDTERHLVFPQVQRRVNSTHLLSSPVDVYDTDMFQMQLSELLQEVQPQNKTKSASIERVLRKLKTMIEKIPTRDAEPIREAERRLNKESNVAIPLPGPQSDDNANYTFAYKKPTNINVIGSYMLQTTIKDSMPFLVDLSITMPSELFEGKDYLDYRFFHKKAYYIACIAAGIRRDQSCGFKLEYTYDDLDFLRPVILVSSVQDGGEDDFSSTGCQIRIVPVVSQDVFPISKTLPWKICVRTAQHTDHPSSAVNKVAPVYNGTIRADSSREPYFKLLHTASKRFTGFKDACVLWSVWLRQRGFETGVHTGGFGAHEASVIMALLLQSGGPKGKPILSTGYTGYQLFKYLLQFLAARDLVREPVLIQNAIADDENLFRTDTPVFFDGVRGLDVLFKMTPWSYRWLRHEARSSTLLLGTHVLDRFQFIFTSKVNDPLRQFDTLIRLTIPRPRTSEIPNGTLDNGLRALKLLRKVDFILNTALGDRVSLVHLDYARSNPWPLASSNPVPEGEFDITVGLLVNSKNVNRLVDHGPPAEDKSAANAFRKFWGEKAELRRFKDGSILESLIWEDEEQGVSVLQQIVSYIIQRHIGEEGSVRFIAEDFQRLLPRMPVSFQSLYSAYEGLERQFRELEGLPLSIRQLSASDSDLRYASVLPYTQNATKYTKQPIDIIIQFEGSARWPDDLLAIQKTKLAFLSKMAELLAENRPTITTRIGLENEKGVLLNSSFLDIIFPNTTAFRLRVHHDRELILLERQLKDTSADSQTREEVGRAITTYKRTFIHSPAHTRAVRSLCTRFPLLSPTIRLLKHFCSTHLLTPHLPPEILELLTIRTFTFPHPWSPPGSLRTAFLRTLAFIARWDWRSEPFIVDFNGEMTPIDVDAIYTRFEAWRKIDPAMNRAVLFAASNIDREGIAWTERGPSKLVAARFSALARAAWEVVKRQGIDLDARMLFTASLTDYDFVLHLSPKFWNGYGGHAERKVRFKNLHKEDARELDPAGGDPVGLFIDELQRLYYDDIIWFFNSDKRSAIAGLWSPQTANRPWKVNLTYSTKPSEGETEGPEAQLPRVSINRMAILNDIARLGGDMIGKIDVKS